MAIDLLRALTDVSAQIGLAALLTWAFLRLRRASGASVRATAWLGVLLSPVVFLALAWTPAYLVVWRTPSAGAPSPRREQMNATPESRERGLRAASQHDDGAAASVSADEDQKPHGAGDPGSSASAFLRQTNPWVGLLCVWAAGAALCIGRMGLGATRLTRLLARAPPMAHPGLRALLRELADEIGVARPVRLVVSQEARGPFCVGYRRPAIVLPYGTSPNDPTTRMVLAHELAHIIRHDGLWNVVTGVIGAVFFWHPALRLAGREYRLASEQTCDAWAVHVTGSRREYADCLMRHARHVAVGHPLGFSQTRSMLGRRMRAVLQDEGDIAMLDKRSTAIAAAIGFALAFLISGSRLLAAAAEEAAERIALPAITVRLQSTRVSRALYAPYGQVAAVLRYPRHDIPDDATRRHIAGGGGVNAVVAALRGLPPVETFAGDRQAMDDALGAAIRAAVRSAGMPAPAVIECELDVEWRAPSDLSGAAQSQIDLVARPRPASVSGRVTDGEGEPIRFVHLILMDVVIAEDGTAQEERSQPLVEVATRSDGSFTMEQVAPGLHSFRLAYEWDPVHLAQRGYRPVSMQVGAEIVLGRFMPFAKSPDLPFQGIAITVAPQTRVSRRVLQADGTPVANANMPAVIDCEADDGLTRERHSMHLDTNAEGRYAFYIEQRGLVRLSARLGGIDARSKPIRIGEDGVPIDGVDLVVGPSGSR